MQLPGLTVGIVADDMTGANDTALQFFPASSETRIVLDLEQPPASPEDNEDRVWAINTDSRHRDPNTAEALVSRAVTLMREQYGVDNFYKKMDSTLRGNIAHECLAMLDVLQADCAVIAPAYPQEGRRTVGGYQLVQGIPVERTTVGRDPLAPVRMSHIPTLLEQMTTPEIVGYIPLSTVLHGAGPLVRELGELIRDGKKLVVVDATSTEDLEQIALAIEKIQKTAKVVPAGSGGLAQALTRFWLADTQHKHEAVPTAPAPILIVSGSNSEVTRDQMVQLIENYRYYGEGSRLEIFDLSPEKILGLTPLDGDVEQILKALDGTNTVILSTSLKEENYFQTLKLAKEHEISDKQATLMAQERLAQLTKRVMQEKTVKLVVTGGETASHVCREIESRLLKVIAQAEPAVPLTQDNQGRFIVTKSGSFGHPMTLANIVRYLKQWETASLHV